MKKFIVLSFCLLVVISLFMFACSSSGKGSSSSATSSSSSSTYSWKAESLGYCKNKVQTVSAKCKDSSGNVVSDSLCSGTKPTTQSCTHYASIPSDGNFIDPTNDIFNSYNELLVKIDSQNKLNFIDLTNMSVNITNSNIEIRMTMKEIPEKLTFNSSKSGLHKSEYEFGFIFDIDGDEEISLGDIEINSYYIKRNTTEFIGKLQDNLETSMYECTKFYSNNNSCDWSGLSKDIIKLTISNNKLIFNIDKTKASTTDLEKISKIKKETTKILFYSAYDNSEIQKHYYDMYPNYNW